MKITRSKCVIGLLSGLLVGVVLWYPLVKTWAWHLGGDRLQMEGYSLKLAPGWSPVPTSSYRGYELQQAGPIWQKIPPTVSLDPFERMEIPTSDAETMQRLTIRVPRRSPEFPVQYDRIEMKKSHGLFYCLSDKANAPAGSYVLTTCLATGVPYIVTYFGEASSEKQMEAMLASVEATGS